MESREDLFPAEWKSRCSQESPTRVYADVGLFPEGRNGRWGSVAVLG
jgi:hypothetical protein